MMRRIYRVYQLQRIAAVAARMSGKQSVGVMEART